MAFVGSYGTPGLRSARVDPTSGRLVLTSAVDVPDVSWLAVCDGRLYATNERAEGTVTVLAADTLTVLEQRSSHGADPTHLSVVDGHVLIANHGSNIAVLPPTGPASDVVPGVRPHQVVPDPTGRWVLAVFLGTDSIAVGRLVEGRLRPHRRVSAGPGPRHIVWHGRRAYVVCENAPMVLTCGWDAATGELTVQGAVDTGVPGDYPGEGVLSTDGRFLYVTNRGSNTISTFRTGNGRLRRLPDVPCGGDWPRHAALDPTQRWLYVSNQRSSTVTWLPRDPVTGELTPALGSIKVPDVALVSFPPESTVD